jgi:hypothetical protein
MLNNESDARFNNESSLHLVDVEFCSHPKFMPLLGFKCKGFSFVVYTKRFLKKNTANGIKRIYFFVYFSVL